MNNIPFMGRERYGAGAAAIKPQRTGARWLKAVPCSCSVASDQNQDNLLSQPSTLSLMLLNARSALNKVQLIRDLILDEIADLACITETWVGAEAGVALSLICPTRYSVQQQGKLEGRGGGVAII